MRNYSKEFIEQNKYSIYAILKDDRSYVVDYVNLAEECEENELNFVVVDRTDIYLTDNVSEYKRLYLSDLADKDNVVLYKLEPLEE